MAFMYIITGLGITVGYHRMLTHKAFQASKPVEYFWAILGSMAVQGPAIAWVADHRKHHAHTDEEGDPHSPHVGQGSGLKGLWFAHVGWLTKTQGSAEFRKYAPDLCEDKGMRWISRNFLAFVGLSLLIPFVLGFVLHGFSLTGALWTLLWAGFVRMFFLHHATWSINSVCHFFGRRRFDVEDKSTNVAWLAIPTFGESWHHNHHAFPRSARAGPRPLGGRHLRDGHLDDGAPRPGPQRRADRARAPGREARRRQAARARAGRRLSAVPGPARLRAAPADAARRALRRLLEPASRVACVSSRDGSG